VVVATEVHLSAFLRSGASRDVSSDSITGEALVVGPRGETASRSTPPSAPTPARPTRTSPAAMAPSRATTRAGRGGRWGEGAKASPQLRTRKLSLDQASSPRHQR
jgi:hypothetical protein